jgi:glycosyltransferase involved in cell wall biosynthesis
VTSIDSPPVPRTQRILSVHNFYQQPGGEDNVFATEIAMLEQRGHKVARFTEDNHRIGRSGLGTGCSAVWSTQSYRGIRSISRDASCQVAHFHNTFPLISPAGYYAARSAGAAVVQTLHNYRLLCPGATLYRSGAVCEECIEKRSLLPAIRHGCYRDSRPATTAVAAMLAIHRVADTWREMVDVYIALTEFARRKFIEGGLPSERVVVKPNFVAPDPGVGTGQGGFALFAGRLSEGKGIHTLLEAWRRLPDVPLIVAGDGPLNTTEWPPGVTWLGRQSREQVLALMKDAFVLIVPSTWYEGAPGVVIEALACGLPVIASDIGSIPELVDDHRTGLLFLPGGAEDLAHKVRWAFDHPERMLEMRAAARREYETKYTADINYKRLMEIYEMAIENAHRA